MKVKISKGDTVEVISGNDKGHRGEVQRLIRRKTRTAPTIPTVCM
jgi:ribosomal protein L24